MSLDPLTGSSNTAVRTDTGVPSVQLVSYLRGLGARCPTGPGTQTLDDKPPAARCAWVPGIRARSPGRGGRYFSTAPPLALQGSVQSCLRRDARHSKGPDQVQEFDYLAC